MTLSAKCVKRVLIFLGSVFVLAGILVHPVEGDDRDKASSSTQEAYVGLKLTAHDASGTVVATDKAIGIYLHSDATDGWDFYDASKIIPSLTDEFALLAFVGQKNGSETLKAQESRPYESDTVDVIETRLIRSNALPEGLTYTLSVTDWYQMPEGWTVRIKAESIDEPMVFDSATSSYKFSVDTSTKSAYAGGAKASSDTTEVPLTSEVRRSSSLPVELSAFDAEMDGSDIRLTWRTVSETNNAGFYVEHLGSGEVESDEWEDAGFVDGAGTTTESKEYKYTVSSVGYGTHRFRLRQVDTDGTVHLSETVRVERRLDQRVSVDAYPNPFASQVSVSLSAKEAQSVTVSLYDITGRRVLERKQSLSAHATRRVRLSGRQLSAGTYLLRVRGRTFQKTRQIVHVE